MLFKYNYFLFFLLGLSLLNACKKEDTPIPPTATFTVSTQSAVVGDTIQFTNTADNAVSFKWSFGDGTISTEAAPVKAYQTADNFTVSLMTTGPGGTNLSSSTVKVLPFCGFIVENKDALNVSTPVQFTNLSKGAASYFWTFGDATNATSTATNPTFQYTEGGTYTVSLNALSTVGVTTFSTTITVAGAPAVKELFHIEYGNTVIKKLTLDGSGTTATVLDITGKAGAGMALDAVNNKIYFSDFEVTGSGNIWRMNPDGTDLTAIVSNLTDPYGIAVDPAGGKIYWTDDAGNVSRANLDGTALQTGIVNIAAGQMRAISLDPENDKMYFYEVNQEILYVANLDGTNVTALLTGTYGYAILVDTVHDKIYYDDQNANKLFRVNLDGSGQETIDADGTRIYGMAIDYDDGKIYWSGRDNGKIIRANLDGTNPETLKSALASPRGIALKQ